MKETTKERREKVIEKYSHDFIYLRMTDLKIKEVLERFLEEILIADSPQGPEDVESKKEKICNCQEGYHKIECAVPKENKRGWNCHAGQYHLKGCPHPEGKKWWNKEKKIEEMREDDLIP